MRPYKENNFEARVLFVALAPVIATAMALTMYFTLLRYNDVELGLSQRGITLTRQLVPAAQYGLFSGNVVELDRLARAIAKEPDVSAITFHGQHGKVLVSAGKTKNTLLPKQMIDGWSGLSADRKTLLFHAKVLTSALHLNDPYNEKPRADHSKLLLGSVTVELSRSTVASRKQEILVIALISALIILIAASVLARRLSHDITDPVIALEQAVNRIGEGMLTTRIQPHRAKTLRSLEDGINGMAAALEAAHSQSAEDLNSSETELRQQFEFANALLRAQSDAGTLS